MPVVHRLDWRCGCALSARFRSSTASPAVGSAPLKIKTHVDKTPLEADTNPGFGANVRGLGHNNYLGKILNARVYELARETPLQHAANLSAQLQNRVLLKREDMQPVFSFKIRGAYNKIAQLSREQLAAGIVACSAGNHAQGVALSAVHLGIDAVIIMPTATPAIKVNAVRKSAATWCCTAQLRRGAGGGDAPGRVEGAR